MYHTQSEICAILIATAAKLLLYDVRVTFNLGFEVNTRPQLGDELEVMGLALVVESVGNVIAMAVQKRQGVSHVSMLSGERRWETLLYMASTSVGTLAAVLYTFALRNPAWFCPGEEGGGFCGCGFVERSNVLRAFCCMSDVQGEGH